MKKIKNYNNKQIVKNKFGYEYYKIKDKLYKINEKTKDYILIEGD